MQIKDSMECAKSELDLFSVPPTNIAIEEGHWDNIQPHPNFDQSPVIRFDITVSQFSKLKFRINILKKSIFL